MAAMSGRVRKALRVRSLGFWSLYDFSLYGCGHTYEHDGKQVLAWGYTNGSLVQMAKRAREFWAIGRMDEVVFRLSDCAIVYRHE